MRRWLIHRGVPLLCMVVLLASPAVGQAGKVNAPVNKPRLNETTLALLRPGKTTLAEADKLYGAQNRTRFDDPDTVVSYQSACWRSLQLDVDVASKRQTIRTVTLTDLRLADSNITDCSSWDEPKRAAMGARWKTGRGIGLGSTKRSVLAAYGPPPSSGPSTLHGRPLELLYYAFDWAGTGVPQVMEVTLDRGRVVQITLAFPSL